MKDPLALLKEVKPILLCIFYAINLYIFYGVIVWRHSEFLLQICHGYWSCDRHLGYQWFGWQVDLGDGQWKSFHNNLPLLLSVAVGLSLVNLVIRKVSPGFPLSWIRLISGLVILFVQHGYYALVILSLAMMGYYIAYLFSGSFIGPYFVWGYAFFILAFKESYRLLPYYPKYRFLHIFFDNRYGGMYGWQFAANFLILRLISYGIDLHSVRNASRSLGDGKKTDNKAVTPTDNAIRELPVSALSLEAFNALNFLAYVVYAPLYVAGPILSFQDFVVYDVKSQEKESVLKYALRFFLLFLLMEWCTSRYPVFALMKAGILPHMRVSEIAITFYVILKVMWLKFTTLWRFFRLWALADGVYVEENMQRCMSNNYSLEQFWRGWHASYNKWIIRYIYVPWGGRSYRWISVWFVFMFVALWHDIEWKLVIWGLMNGSFYVLESLIKGWWVSNTTDTVTGKLAIPSIVDHIVSSVSGAVYVMVLMVINLVGYALGTGAFGLLQQKVVSSDGLLTILTSFYFLSVGVSIMLSLRHYKLCKD